MLHLVSETEAKKHAHEAQEMHNLLNHSNVGREISNFIVRTGACKLDLTDTSMSKVLQISQALMMTLNMQNGPERIGLLDDNMNLARFVVIGDLMGQRIATWSTNPTMIRELCASFYGPSSVNFGHGSILRHEIDEEVRIASQSTEVISLCLVIVSPWGESISDRFWRLMTIKHTDSGAYKDSERVLTSMQRPPATLGSSVLGNSMNKSISCSLVDAFCNDWHAVNLDSCIKMVGDGAEDCSGIQGKQISVLRGLLSQLKGENTRLQQSLGILKESKEKEVNARVQNALDMERRVLYTDIESLHKRIDDASISVLMERAKCSVLANELKNTENDTIHSLQQMQRLKGEILVNEDTIDTLSKRSTNENEKSREALKQCKAELKRMEAMRKQEVEKTINEKCKRIELECNIESQRAAFEALQAKLQEIQIRESRFRETASEQTGRILDINQTHSAKIKRLEEHINTMELFQERLSRYYVSQIVSRRIAAQFKAHLCRSTKHTPVTLAVTTQTTTTTTRPQIHVNQFPADAIASANASISMLKNFVERASSVSEQASHGRCDQSNAHGYMQQHQQCVPYYYDNYECAVPPTNQMCFHYPQRYHGMDNPKAMQSNTRTQMNYRSLNGSLEVGRSGRN